MQEAGFPQGRGFRRGGVSSGAGLRRGPEDGAAQSRPGLSSLVVPGQGSPGLRDLRAGCPGSSGASVLVEMDQRLAELVEELTTSGEPRLEPGRMKELKKICKYGRREGQSRAPLVVPGPAVPGGAAPRAFRGPALGPGCCQHKSRPLKI